MQVRWRKTYLFHTSEYVFSTTVRRAKMRIHTLLALKVEKIKPRSGILPSAFHAPLSRIRACVEDAGPGEWRKKKRFGASGYSTILCDTYICVPLCCHPLPNMCCEQFVICNFQIQNTSRELYSEGRLGRCSWTHLLVGSCKARGLREFGTMN